MTDSVESTCPTCGNEIPSAAPQQMCPVCLLQSHTTDRLPGGTDEDIIGNYLILEPIGVGGMGRVYRAEQTSMRRQVALKVLNEGALASASAKQRFLRESEAIARLEHKNIVRAFDAGEADGRLYLAMELIDGIDLDQMVKDQGALSIGFAVGCITQAAAGLAYAHKKGVIHRDIKPGNLILDENEVIKVLDLGIARLNSTEFGDKIEIEHTFLTNPEQLVGTVDFMSPEQAVDPSGVDERSDIYSLGITLWYLLTGKIAYEGDTLTARLLAHQQAPIPSLGNVCPMASSELQAVFEKMIAKDPANRFRSMLEVQTALGKIPLESKPGQASQRRKSIHRAVVVGCALLLGGAIIAWKSDLIPHRSKPALAEFGAIITPDQAQALQSKAAVEHQVEEEITNKVGIKLRLIPSATYYRGTPQEEVDRMLEFDEDTLWQERVRSEAPQQLVTISRPFYLGRSEVTQQEYASVMAVNPSHFVTGKGRDADTTNTSQFPVDSVTWSDAVTFCNLLSRSENLSPYYQVDLNEVIILEGKGYRLPSAAEWELACRAGTSTAWHFGSDESQLQDYGWYEVNSTERPHATGLLKPNPFGLHDMHGNLWEWCQDWYGPYKLPSDTTAVLDPAGPAQGTQRAMRGGSFISRAIDTRCAYRDSIDPQRISNRRGFRVAKDL